MGVVGFVENQPDGTVNIVAEGEGEILEEFVEKAQPEDDPLIRITQVDVEYEKATGEFELFGIKHRSSEERLPIGLIPLQNR
ncbi:MAG: Acylphosphatase [Candidatus Argoarchaeum ethanivorans]|uniref:Acylphosphatase n=1 Tax=Candidatus Argoarchaeum ethanivorans TaxID=2608793 RepID=A0A811TAB5_9EURY|nr:MAG: Acylphosphatase [Candidatus Argoarchaeum ethanivorans]